MFINVKQTDRKSETKFLTDGSENLGNLRISVLYVRKTYRYKVKKNLKKKKR